MLASKTMDISLEQIRLLDDQHEEVLMKGLGRKIVLFSSEQNVVGGASLHEQSSICGNRMVFFPDEFHRVP